eukprot:12918180-Ditylum_brightwellii.AAC.1
METRSCWHFNRCRLHYLLHRRQRRSIHDLVGPSTAAHDTTFYIGKGKHPSSQTEKMCLETEVKS